MSEAKRNSAAGLQHAGEAVEIGRADEAPLPVPLLRPGVGIEQVDADRATRRGSQSSTRVASSS